MPYKGWNNRKVIEQVAAGYRLPKPFLCPDGIYEIMIKCWHKNPKVQWCFAFFFSFSFAGLTCACLCVQRRLTFAKINQMLVDQWNETAQDVRVVCRHVRVV